MLSQLAAAMPRVSPDSIADLLSRVGRGPLGSALARLEPPPMTASLAFAEAIIPPAARVPGGDEKLLRDARELFGEAPAAWAILGWAQTALDWAAVASTGRRFSSLSRSRQQELLRSWQKSRTMRTPLAVVSTLYKSLHFDLDHVYGALGGERPQAAVETERWMSQVTRADEWTGDTTIECDVVVVGTGAGGAVVGRELADRGHAVVFVEEGEFLRRHQLGGGSIRSAGMFRGKPLAFAVGNNVFPVFIGRAVGGSTITNTASCWRTPSWILDEWCELLGTDDVSPANMAPRFERVETELQVVDTTREHAGPIANIIARGCEQLGWSHLPVARNAPDCRGEGFCQFGCASGARRSTERSYIPKALQRGSVLLAGLRAEKVLLESGRAAGIEGVAVDSGRALRVRANVVVLAGGAVPTPTLLNRQGLCQTSGQVGQNLTLHPSAGVAGIFDEPTRPNESVPQGWACDEFLREGIMLLAAQPSYSVLGMMTPLLGDGLAELVDRAQHVANIGILAEDAGSVGRIQLDRGGHVLLRYSLNAEAIELVHRGIVKGCEMLFAAGARKVIPGTQPVHEITNAGELGAYAAQKRRADELLLVSYHPLGTCRMGRDPRESVIGPDHEAHDTPGLFIVDGSAVPTPVGVNPQITIMAMATRAAEIIDQKL